MTSCGQMFDLNHDSDLSDILEELTSRGRTACPAPISRPRASALRCIGRAISRTFPNTDFGWLTSSDSPAAGGVKATLRVLVQVRPPSGAGAVRPPLAHASSGLDHLHYLEDRVNGIANDCADTAIAIGNDKRFRIEDVRRFPIDAETVRRLDEACRQGHAISRQTSRQTVLGSRTQASPLSVEKNRRGPSEITRTSWTDAHATTVAASRPTSICAAETRVIVVWLLVLAAVSSEQ